MDYLLSTMDFVPYIDESDQHALEDEGDVWLRGQKAVPWPPSDQDEEEKACLDSTISTPELEFSRVYAVHDHSKVPVDQALVHKGSPSEPFVKNPYIMRQAVKSSVRLRVTFQGRNPIFGSGFYIGPSTVLTAGHIVRDRPNNAALCEILSHQGKVAFPSSFQSASCNSGVILAKDCSFCKPSNNLYNEGSDCAFIHVTQISSKFLLPCSMTFLTTHTQKDCVVLSFPGVTEYVQRAEYELNAGIDSKIWRAHLPAMQQKLSQTAKTMSKDEKDLEVVKRVKQSLLNMLSSTFGPFATGQLLCSVGVVLSANGCSLSTTCSTLPGSSGGAVCLIEHPENVVGVHTGGFPGAPTNIATSCDNPTFVSFYFAKAFSDLPKPDEIQSTAIEGFVHWLRLHSPSLSPVWLREVKEFEKLQQRGKKRCLATMLSAAVETNIV